MTTPAIYPTVDAYLDAVETARAAAQAYYHGDGSGIDDATYDELAQRIAATETAHPDWRSAETVTGKVAGGTGAGSAVHRRPMLSLDNVFSADELNDWYERLRRALGREPGRLVVEPKLDGLALSAIYENGTLVRLATRGDGTVGEDVTDTLAVIAGLPATLAEPVDVEIRGEAMMTDDDFAAANTLRAAHGESPLVNPRNGAAGALRAKDKPYRLPLTFWAYDAPELELGQHATLEKLRAFGVNTALDSAAGATPARDASEALAAIEALGARRGELGFAIDGAVIKADALADRAAGSTAKAPRWAVAFKYPADMRLTRLVGIELQVGRTGAVTPVGKVEPVFVGGTTVTSVTLHNATEIGRKDLRVGDMVWVRRAGEVIPEIVGVAAEHRPADAPRWEAPTTCPRCSEPLDTDAKVWRCPSGRTCGTSEAFLHACGRSALDIDGIGREVVDALVASGRLGDVADLYTLTVGDLEDLVLSGRKLGGSSAQRIVDGCAAARTLPLHRHLTALGIRHLGAKLARTVAEAAGDLATLLSFDRARLEAVDGIGPERAETIVAELAELAPVLAKLQATGVNLTEPVRAGGGTLDGKTVAVTGTVEGWTRAELEELVRRAGGKPAGSVSKTTGLVVVGANAGSKAARAYELGVATVDAATFIAEHRS